MEDLWPENFSGFTPPDPPVVILRKQGTILGAKTNNILEGEVVSHMDDVFNTESIPSHTSIGFGARIAPPVSEVTSAERPPDRELYDPVFLHSFYIKVPSLGNYRHRLFYVRHPVLLYPVTIYWQEKQIDCPDENVFKDSLRMILGNSDTTRIVKVLLSQARSPVGATS